MRYEDTSKIERAIAGALTLSEKAISVAIASGLTPQMFKDDKCRAVFEAAAEVSGQGLPVDLVTLTKPCRSRGVSPAELAAMTGDVASADHIAAHIEVLRAAAVRRSIVDLGERIVRDDEVTLSDIADFVESASGDSKNRTLPLRDTLKMSVEAVCKRCDDRANGRCDAIRTGLSDLDRLIIGWQKASLNIIAARPGMGKTAFAIAMALRAAHEGRHVLYFTLEMSARAITDRIILAESGVNAQDFRRGEMSDRDLDTVMGTADKVAALPIYINDSAVVTVEYIRSVAKSLSAQGLCDMVVIDYLQLITPSGGNSNGTREQEVARISRALLLLSKEIDAPVLLLAQLSRAVEARQNKRPQLSDLRESGAIEQDADTVTFLYRPDYYNRDEYTGEGVAIVAKQREGRLGDAIFHHNEQMSNFYD